MNKVYSSHWERHSKSCDGFGDMMYTKPWHKVMNWLCIKSYNLKLKYEQVGKEVSKEIGGCYSYDCFRQVCALETILQYINIPKRVLIVGDGYGYLGCLINELFLYTEIVFIDIPEILAFQRKVARGEFYKPYELDKVDGKFDLIINIASMQEMTVDMIDEYFKLFKRVSNGIFYCCNRVKKVLIGGEVTEFFKYPWEGEILLDEEPIFYRYYYYHKPPFKRYLDGKMWHRIVRFKP